MSLEHAAKFTIAAANDPVLTRETNAAVAGKNAAQAAAAFATLAASRGYECTTAEAAEVLARVVRGAQLSDKELDRVAGGITGFEMLPPDFDIGAIDVAGVTSYYLIPTRELPLLKPPGQ